MAGLVSGRLTGSSIAKATDENLTSENWEYIMDVVDKVGSEESGGKDAVASLIKRLAHRNANVQLYTLEVGAPPHSQLGADLTSYSSRTPSAKTANRRYSGNSPREHSPMPCCALQMTEIHTSR